MIATFGLAVVMMMGVSTANGKGGLLMADLTGGNTNEPCTEQKSESKLDWGIIITDFGGIIITDFTGIIIVAAAETPVDCGIIITD